VNEDTSFALWQGHPALPDGIPIALGSASLVDC